MSKGLKTTLIIVCVILVVALVVFSTMVVDGFFAAHTTAARIGDHELSASMVNYYYREAYSQFSNYASALGIDTNKSLAKQYVDSEQTQSWADYLIDLGLNSAATSYAIYDKAIAAGYTLSEDRQEALDSSISSLDLYAAMNSLKDADAYVAATYGAGCNVKSYREYMLVSTVVNSYLSDFYNNLTYTDSELTAEYEANKNNYDSVSYRMICVDSSFFAEDAENVADQIEDLAQSILDAADSEEAFTAACAEKVPDSLKENYTDENATLYKDASYSATSSLYAEWLFNEERQAGDTTMVANGDTYYVLYFIDRDTHDYLLPNVRHILFQVEDTSDADAMAEAKSKAEAVLADFEASDKSEETFAKLASENSDDTSAENGGLIENIFPDQMVANFSDWCFDESRQAGDYDLIETEYGYHLMFFSGYGATYKKALVENNLKNAALDVEMSDSEEYTVIPAGIHFVTK